MGEQAIRLYQVGSPGDALYWVTARAKRAAIDEVRTIQARDDGLLDDELMPYDSPVREWGMDEPFDYYDDYLGCDVSTTGRGIIEKHGDAFRACTEWP